MQRETFGKARRYRVTVGTLGSLRRAMPKRAIIVSATAGLVLGSLVAAAPARAESKSKQVDQITCEEFLAMKSDEQQHIAYWVDGYQTAKGDAAVGVVAFDKFGKPIGALVDECKTAPKETLWQKLKKLL
jgi:acid stress chaperone HdeA